MKTKTFLEPNVSLKTGFLIFITFLMMPPVGSICLIKFLNVKFKNASVKPSVVNPSPFHKINLLCTKTLVFASFFQILLYLFTVTLGYRFIGFLDSIY